MSEHLKKITGSKSEMLLYKITDKPVKGIAVGAGVTALIQSSSASCAMVVSLVESDLLSLERAISIILGSILGTSVTAWLIAYSSISFSSAVSIFFSSTFLSAITAIIGIFFKLFMKKQRIKRIGEILLGFALLMLGISTIATAVEPLKESELFIKSITGFENPLLLILIGVLFAMLLQSASAAVGILQTLCITGIFSLNSTFALIIGISIGAAFPVIIASIGKRANAKRAALSYLLADVIGAVVLGVVFYSVLPFISAEFKQIEVTPTFVALLNTVYRFAVIVILYPFMSTLKKLCCKLIKDKRYAHHF